MNCRTVARSTRIRLLVSGLILFQPPLAIKVARGEVPGGAAVVAGSATIATQGNTLNVTTHSDRAIINWQNFSIGAGNAANFHQPGADSAVLNRVITPNNPSAIYGQLNSNGQVYLINPSGIIIGPSGLINANGFTASTLDISNKQFMQGGPLTFQGDSTASVINQGTIQTGSGGAALLGNQVLNSGTITSQGGSISLATGGSLTLADGSRYIQADVGTLQNGISETAPLINNTGTIRATGALKTGGEVYLVNPGGKILNSGTLQARRSSGDGGSVRMAAGGSVTTTGTIDASSPKRQGGSVEISGGAVALGGVINADGATGGSVSVRSENTVSLADTVQARGLTDQGGSVTVEAGGRVIENSSSVVDVSGITAGGQIRVTSATQIGTSGHYDASAAEGFGGLIDLTAPDMRLFSTQLDASGPLGGGLVRLGGEFQGGRLGAAEQLTDLFGERFASSGPLPVLVSADTVLVNDGVMIDVSSTGGMGGSVVVWSEQQTTFLGSILAGGSADTANGGGVEISSADHLRHANLGGVSGASVLLLDPKNITIAATGDAPAWSYEGIIGFAYNGDKDVRLSSSILNTDDYFGSGVSLNADGDRLAVGAYFDDGFGNSLFDSGAVHLFTFTDTNFGGGALAGTIGHGYSGGNNVDLSGILGGGDEFGSSVSLNADGDRLAVGARGDDGFTNGVSASGAVYLFSFTDTSFSGGGLSGTIGHAYSGGNNVDLGGTLGTSDQFGASVSLNALGDRLAVGTRGDDGFGNVLLNSGAAHLFTFTDGNFSGGALAGTIGHGYSGGGNVDLSGTLSTVDEFGSSVSLNAAGDRLAVGAWGDDGFGNLLGESGAVHLFTFTDSAFSGGALSGTIGHGYSGGNSLDLTGTLNSNDFFGSSVSLNATGDRLAVGALFDDGFGNVLGNSGAVHLFNFTDSRFSGGALAGSIGHGYSGGNNVDLSGKLGAGDYFGASVSLTAAGDRLAVGAERDDGFGNDFHESGAVHLFSFTDTNFSGGVLSGTIGHGYSGANDVNLRGTLDAYDYFGRSVSLNAAGDRLAVGAWADDGFGNVLGDSGAVHLFIFTDTNFSGGALAGTIGHGYSGGNNVDISGTLGMVDYFGNSVSLNAAGDRLAVGALLDDGFGNSLGDSGAAHLFTFTDASFSGGALAGSIGHGYTGGNNVNLSGTLDGGDYFGSGVSLNAVGDRLAVGALRDDGFGNSLPNSGVVYLFTFTDTSFSGGGVAGTIGHGYTGGNNVDISGTLNASDEFGSSLSLNAAGDRLAVGAFYDDGFANGLGESGAVRLFTFTDTSFGGGGLAGTIGYGYTGGNNVDISGTLNAGDFFGSSVSLNAAGNRLAVGAERDDGFGNSLSDSGVVHLFTFTDSSFSGGGLSGSIGHGYTGGTSVDLSGTLAASDEFGSSVSFNAVGDRLAVGAWGDDGFGNGLTNSGAVHLLSLTGVVSPGTFFSSQPGESVTFAATEVAALLSQGTSIILQANNDITVNRAIVSNNPSGNGGSLTMQAGRSILINANIVTDNGDLTLVANETLANGVVNQYRDAGSAVITMAPGTTLAAGSGAVTITLADGAGKTYVDSGAITLRFIEGDSPIVANLGSSADADILLTGAISTMTGPMVLVANRNIIATNAYLTTQGGSITLNSDRDASGAGNIQLFNPHINSNGGAIVLGGGLDPLTTAAVGSGTGSAAEKAGIYFQVGSLRSGIGAISLLGRGIAGTNDAYGVSISNASVVQSSSGEVSIHGTGGGGTSNNHGVYLAGSSTRVISAYGDILITGIGGDGTGSSNHGVFALNGAIVSSTGVGTDAAAITIHGTGGAGSDNNYGIYLSGSPTQVTSVDGDILMTGIGGDGTSGANVGVYIVSGGRVSSTGTGAGAAKITLQGIGGAGPFNNYGVLFTVGGLITSVDGDILVTGIGGDGTGPSDNGFSNYGVYVTNGSVISSTGAGTDAAKITLHGTGGAGAQNNYGVYVEYSNTRITSGYGDILITGIGGDGTGSSNHGVFAQYGAVISSTGTGADAATITLHGTGGAGTSANYGVYLSGSPTQVTSVDGDILMAGIGGNGTSDTNLGIFTSDGVVVSSTGTGADAAKITLHGTGGAGTRSNFGVYLSNSTRITSVYGDILITGIGGDGSSNDQYGVHLTSGVVVSSTGIGTDAATVTLRGTGGAGTSSNYGIWIVNDTTRITSGYGDISIIGIGGDGTGAINHGVNVSDGTSISSTGTGIDAAKITLHGTGGAGTDNNYGVFHTGNALITSVDGDILMIGIGGDGTAAFNYGVHMNAGADISSTGTGTDAAMITVHGTGGTGTNDNYGIRLTESDTQVTSGYGDILITGIGGDGTAASNFGVYVSEGTRITSTGTGTNAAMITVHGTGGAGTNNNYGVWLTGNTQVSRVTSGYGDILITGIGGDGTGAENRGIYVSAASIISTGIGADAAKITFHGRGGSGTNSNSGVQLSGYTITSGYGDILITGIGGDGSQSFNSGIVFLTGSGVTSTGAGPDAAKITLHGTAGAGADSNYGVWLTNFARFTSDHGDISITGVGGDGIGSANSGIYASNVSVSSTGSGTGAAKITLDGDGGTGTDNNHGVFLTDSRVTAADGDILVLGEAGNGASSAGIHLLGSASVRSTGSRSAATSVNAVVLATSGNFVNNAGPSAVSTAAARWLVYSASPATDTFGGLISGNQALYSRTFAANPPTSISESGNRYLFADGLPSLTVTATLTDSKTFGDAYTFPTPSPGTNFTLSGFVDASAFGNVFTQDTAANIGLSGAPTFSSDGAAQIATVSGSPYTVQIAAGTLANTAGYTFDTFVSGGSLTVTPRDITVTALGGSSVYGDSPTNPGLSATNLASFDTVDDLTGLSNSFGIDSTTVVDAYTLSVAGTLTNGNYNVTATNTGTWNVTPKALVVTASDQTKTFGDTFTFAGTEFTTDGLINSDTVTGADLTSLGAVDTANVAGSPYEITIDNATGSGLGNYSISYVGGNLTVTQRDITVTALGGSSVYGDSPVNPGLSAANLASFDTVDDLTGLSNSFGIDNTTTVNSYAMNVLGTLSNTNYNVTETNSGTWNVNPAPLTITANDQSKPLGLTLIFDLTADFTANGLRNNETIGSVLLSSAGAVASAPIGLYAIDVSSPSGGTFDLANYDLTLVPGRLSVASVSGQFTYDQFDRYRDQWRTLPSLLGYGSDVLVIRPRSNDDVDDEIVTEENETATDEQNGEGDDGEKRIRQAITTR